MKIKILSMLFIITGITLLSAQDGYEIMKRMDEKATPKTTHALVQMVLTDQRGQQNERVIEQWSAIDNDGNTHNVMVFHSPASVKNTRFLTKENKDRDDDQWIFLPALNRVRRIAASDGGGSFMGTEFTYHDLESRELDDYSYKYLGKETVQGYECYRVETHPKPGIDSPYAKTISWVTVEEEISAVMKAEIYESETKLLKVMTVEDISEVSGYWIPVKIVMTNTQNQRSTALVQQKLELDKSVNTTRFSQRFLETGKTQ
jgi:Outer membrane lipoprotein-sorting protein